MDLSVIIVSYNEVEYLSKAIDSCLEQTFHDFEIIIGDDGSTDGSLELIESYKKRYPEKIKSFVMLRDDNNRVEIIPSIRVSNVIKEGLAKAQGNYIILLSGDDYFCSKVFFKEAVGALDANPKVSACVSKYCKVWDSGEKMECPTKKLSPYLYWAGYYIHISCFMFRKTVYDQGYLLERFCDDTGLEYSIALHGKFRYINEVSFVYRQRKKSITHKADEMELCLLELLLYQDVCMKGKYRFSSLSRFSKPLNYIFEHRVEINDKKYHKYLQEANNSQYNYIEKIRDYSNLNFVEKISLYTKIKISKLITIFFGVLMNIESMIHR